MMATRESEDGDISDRTDDSTTAIELPPCELSKLDNIYTLVMGSVTPTERLMLGLAIERESYIPKLLDLFHVCEDLENMEGLRQLFDIFRTLIFHNNASMFQVSGIFDRANITCTRYLWRSCTKLVGKGSFGRLAGLGKGRQNDKFDYSCDNCVFLPFR